MGDTLKSTLTNADDAETLAHDALTSIDARANEIKKNMKSARKLQDDHAEMKVWIEFEQKIRYPMYKLIFIRIPVCRTFYSADLK